MWLACGMNTHTKAHTLLFSFAVIAPGPSSLPLGNIINAHHHSMSGWMVGITVSPSNDLLGGWINYHSSHWWLHRERQKHVGPPLQSNTQAFKEDTVMHKFYLYKLCESSTSLINLYHINSYCAICYKYAQNTKTHKLNHVNFSRDLFWQISIIFAHTYWSLRYEAAHSHPMKEAPETRIPPVIKTLYLIPATCTCT